MIALTSPDGTQMVVIAAEGPGYGADLCWQIVGSGTWRTVVFPAGSFGP